MATSTEAKRQVVEPAHPPLRINRQCALLGLARSSYYYQPAHADPETLRVMRLIDEQYTRTPFYGVRKMTAWLRQRQRERVNHKRVARLMRLLGLAAIAPSPRTSRSAPDHQIYPYLLRDVSIERVNHVWSTDITYIRLHSGWLYLVAILDWYSRYVLAWEVSNTLDTPFCLAALEQALQIGTPEIFNSDQGAQFTSRAFPHRLQHAGIRISMDGRGRALDNIFVERLWRSVKDEEVYLHDYENVPTAIQRLDHYFTFYNHERLHQALAYQTPAAVFHQR